MDALLHGQVAAWLMSPLLFVAVGIIRIVNTILGIRAGRQARMIGRVDLIVFLALLTMLVFLSFVSMTIVALGLDRDELLVLVLVIASQAIMYLCVKWSVQRLRSIGWSPHWAWLLNIDGLAFAMMAILCIVPPAANGKSGTGEPDMATPAAI